MEESPSATNSILPTLGRVTYVQSSRSLKSIVPDWYQADFWGFWGPLRTPAYLLVTPLGHLFHQLTSVPAAFHSLFICKENIPHRKYYGKLTFKNRFTGNTLSSISDLAQWYTFNYNTPGSEVGGCLWVQNWLGLHSKFQKRAA